MHFVDTHQHIWDLGQFPYSWTHGVPELSRSFVLEDYFDASAGLGITKTVFMEGDVDPPHALDEARHVQALADAHPLISGIVAQARPEDNGFAEHVEVLLELPSLRGIRRVLHTQSDGLSQQEGFRNNLRTLPRHGLTFDLCLLAHQLPIGIALARACPEVAFILDHCGVPDVKGRALHPWSGYMRELAALPNVVACKVSGIVAYADPERWTVDDLRPWFEHVIKCFGWDRVLWGGDWPVCTLSATLLQWVEATCALASSATDDERARLFHRNAERIYRV